jgi:acetoin utilization deacetylase AcuC-like enzyme
MSTIIIRDKKFIEHDPGYGHPESPSRLKAIYGRLDQDDVAGLFRTVRPGRASEKELAWCHEPAYIERIRRTAGVDHFQLDPDTSTSAASWDAACLAAGGVFTGLEMIFSGEADNGFALVRPPGHHAEYDHAMGFCLFNNIALGAEYAMRRAGAKRVLVVDWDLHHGNGTQNCFYHSPDCLYFSTHQYPYYPGSGALEQAGAGEGEGFTVNVPLYAGAGDDVYASVFNTLLKPVAMEFRPDIILVSAGFDTYRNDPLGGMAVSIYGFAYMARVLLEIASECCGGRILFSLEGGYDLDGLRDGVLAVLLEAIGRTVLDEKNLQRLSKAMAGPQALEQAVEFQKKYWPCLA